MKRRYLKFKPDPFRPINVDNTEKWKKAGKSYVLKNVDVKEDMQHIYAEFKHVVRGTTSTTGVSGQSKEFRDNKKLYIAGMANANIVDRMDERVDPRGLDATDYIKNMQLLAHHSYCSPVGQVEELDIREDGVHFTAWVGDPEKAPLTDMQKEIRSLIAQGILKTVSIGFIPKKIRAGAYDDKGNIVEPWVIEEWELLELSVVAIPANQDSIFEMKGLLSSDNSGKVNTEVQNMKLFNKKQLALLAKKDVAEILEELTKAQACVHKLIFDASMYDKDLACEWAKGYSFKCDDILEADGAIVLEQRAADEFIDDSLEELSLEDGVKSIVGKAKADNEPTDDGTDTEDDGSSDDTEATFRKESMQLIKNINEATKRTVQICSDILAKMEEKAAPCDNEPKPDEEEENPPAKSIDEPVIEPANEPEQEKFMEAIGRIDKLEKTIDKLADIVKKLAEIAA